LHPDPEGEKLREENKANRPVTTHQTEKKLSAQKYIINSYGMLLKNVKVDLIHLKHVFKLTS
jgi:hypothetical protein